MTNISALKILDKLVMGQIGTGTKTDVSRNENG